MSVRESAVEGLRDYCGDVRFVSWRGDKPITVRWELPETVPARLRGELAVP